MEIIHYLFRFVYRIRWWLLVVPFVVGLISVYLTRKMPMTYDVDMTIYTGVVSGYNLSTEDNVVQSSTTINTLLDNIITIMTSKETLKKVSLHLYARHMIYGNPNKDTEYINALNFQNLQKITPPEIKKLIDKSSEERTVENLMAYEKNSHSPRNFIYGLFNWNHPFYSYSALKKIVVKRIGNSDMLEVNYSANDPGVAYQTLNLMSSIYNQEYKSIQFGSTNDAIHYFTDELARVGKDLKDNEDALTKYNTENKVINYDEQTRQVAALGRDYELTSQEILLRYNSANTSIRYLEGQVDENLKQLKGNAEFLAKMNTISNLSGKISEIELSNDGSSPNDKKNLSAYKQQLNEAKKGLNAFTEEFANRKFTREGYPTSNFVTQWVDELLKFEKAKAELKVMDNQKKLLDEQYTHFSPIGSTIKRQERSINFTERNYLSVLSALNIAKLRLKSLEMNTASLKIINPPSYPLGAGPSKRKQLVVVSILAALIFTIGFFLLIDLLDRTLKNPLRTKRITSEDALGAFPTLKKRFSESYSQKSIQHLANSLSGYFTHSGSPRVINFISTEQGIGKSYIAERLKDYWSSNGLTVKHISHGVDFNQASKEYLFAQNLEDVDNENNVDILLMEHAPLNQYAINKNLLQKASVNLMILPANQVWKENDQMLLQELRNQVKDAPFHVYLNNAEKYVVESFTGMLPPYSYWRRLIYHYGQLGFTSRPSKETK